MIKDNKYCDIQYQRVVLGQIFGGVFRALIGKSSQFCSKMQIELVEMFNTEQRNNLWV